MPTTGISLVRHHTEQMQLPRFLWVPFPLGRPFGAPHAPDFQRRVLRTALELFDRTAGPVLEDFPDDAPATDTAGEDATWSCPVSFAPVDDDRSDLVRAALAELDRLEPWLEQSASGRGFRPVSGRTAREIVGAFGAVVEGASIPTDERPLQEWVRLACEDLHALAIEASKAQPGNPSVQQREDWFWTETAIARLIAALASRLVEHDSPLVKAIAQRGLVPRTYLSRLMPDVEPFI